MTHPAVYALGLTVAIGFALFSYFVTSNPGHYNIPNQRQQQYQPNPRTSNDSYERERSSSFRRRRKSKDNNERVCSICLDTIEDREIRTLPCKHSFHAACVRKLKESRSVLCPNCRMPF